MTGPIVGGRKDDELASDCEFLSVKIDEPLVETPSRQENTIGQIVLGTG